MTQFLTAKIDKIVDAPIEKVYDTWIKADTLKFWFGPPGHVVTSAKLNVCKDGEYEIIMLSPEKNRYTLKGKFIEIIPYEKLIYTWYWNKPELGEYETQVTVSFISEKSGTRVTIHHEKFLQHTHCEGHTAGWLGSIERIGKYFTLK